MSIQTPDWVKDAVFYQIFPDRFAYSERLTKPANLESWAATPTRRGFKGGDMLGVLEHLDYLEALGVNALYFNPVFESRRTIVTIRMTTSRSIQSWGAMRLSPSYWRRRTSAASG